MKDKLTLNIDEAAELLGIGRNLMLKLVTVDDFPAIKFKRKIIINKQQLQQWLDKHGGSTFNY